jgi:hypothetical protein
LGEEEMNWERLKLSDYNNLKIISFFEHKFTWIKYKTLKSIIDFYKTAEYSVVQMEDVQVFKRANCVSGHLLVRSKTFLPWIH